MKIISDLVQGSQKWLEFRRNHLGATDAGVIMQMNPWRTRLSLWEEKTLGWELEFDQESLDRMALGTAMEPIARKAYSELTGLTVNPLVVESIEYPFLSASLDGINILMTRAVEIKCGASSHRSAANGQLPAYYYCQVQHQMLVTGLHSIDYFSYHGLASILITVERDEQLIKELLEKEIEFWHNVQTGTPPED